MALLIENLSDEYLNEMAAYFSSLSVPYPAVRGMLDEARTQTARRLVTLGDPGKDIPSCMACHGKALMGIAPDIPGLLGLPADYINAQFGAWRVGSRHAQAPDCMAERQTRHGCRSERYLRVACNPTGSGRRRVPIPVRTRCR